MIDKLDNILIFWSILNVDKAILDKYDDDKSSVLWNNNIVHMDHIDYPLTVDQLHYHLVHYVDKHCMMDNIVPKIVLDDHMEHNIPFSMKLMFPTKSRKNPNLFTNEKTWNDLHDNNVIGIYDDPVQFVHLQWFDRQF